MGVEVGSAWSQKGWVEFLSVIGGHEQNSSFLRSHTIKGIEKAGKCDMLTIMFSLDALPLHENAINIFKEDN